MKLEDLYTEAELEEGWLCRAFSRHFLTEGNMFEETDSHGLKRWVNRLRCHFCGTRRITPLVPKTREYIRNSKSPHEYIHMPHYRTDISTADALADLLRRLSVSAFTDRAGNPVTSGKVRSIQGSRGRKAR